MTGELTPLEIIQIQLSELSSLELNKPTSLRDVRVYQRYLEYKKAFPEGSAKSWMERCAVDFGISIESVGTIIYVKLYRLIKHLGV